MRQGFFGQEINLTTYNLAPDQHVPARRQLREVRHRPRRHADSIPPHWDDEPFEAIVSNPPYSIKWDGDANPLLINDPRFAPAGVLAPKSKADLAFTMHMLSWLAVNGTAAIVEFPGVLYRGGAEQKIRKYLDRQQLRRHRHPAAAGPLLRHHDRDLHHRAEEVQDRQRRAVHRRVGGVRPPGQQEQAHRGQPAEDPRRVHGPRGRRPLREAGRERRRSPRTATTSPCPSYVEAEDTRESRRHHGAQRRDRPDRRAPGRAAHRRSTPSSPTWKARSVSRIDDLIAELCPDGVEFKTLGEVGTFIRGNGARSRTSSTTARRDSLRSDHTGRTTRGFTETCELRRL